MAHPKSEHYWTQLRIALTAGRWSSSAPARAPNGKSLSWAELLRKFNKHCTGYSDVAEVASQTQALSLLLEANSKDVDQDETCSLEDVYPPREDGILSLGKECLLPPERHEEARVTYEGLKLLRAENDDVLCSDSKSLTFALAYYAFALGRPAVCLYHLSGVLDIDELQNHIPTITISRSSKNSTLHIPGSVLGTSASSWTDSFVSYDVAPSIVEIKDGRAWALIEAFRTICLQGMSHELLSPREPFIALDAYSNALPLFARLTSMISVPTATTSQGKLDFSSFSSFRELWRWVERLLSRAVILAARVTPLRGSSSQENTLGEEYMWKWLNYYSEFNKYWPTTFRTHHRSVIAALHLRTFVLLPPSLPLSPSSYRHSSTHWLHSARTVVNEYRAILDISTKFPKAGERNELVEEFVDLCVAIWEASGSVGEDAGWVIDILWWATRLTFNSQRILRHMSRLFYVSGDPSLAKRTLRLYVQVVSKAFEAGSLGVDGSGLDDVRWVETLVQGARMLCRIASRKSGLEGLAEAREAGTLVEKAKKFVGKDDGVSSNEGNRQLKASVLLAEGVWNYIMADKEQDHRTRPMRLSKSLALFTSSVKTWETPSACYHLALALARPGGKQDLEEAIGWARKAVEYVPGEMRFWHLLGLLLAGNEQWAAAKGVLEQGAALSEGDAFEEEKVPDKMEKKVEDIAPNEKAEDNGETRRVVTDEEGIDELRVSESKDGIDDRVDGLPNGHRDYAASQSNHSFLDPTLTIPSHALLDLDSNDLPPAATLLSHLPDSPRPSRMEVFEHALQLRMTQVALTEYVEGAEGAADKWVEVFSWVAERRGIVTERHRIVEGGRLSLELRSRSEIAVQLSEKNTHHSSHSPEPLHSRWVGSNSRIHHIPKIITKAGRSSLLRSVSDRGLDKSRHKQSSSIERDTTKSKKVQRMLKHRVHMSQARISTISKRIGSGVVRNGSVGLRRANSAPDFNSVLQHSQYQASSIHSRRRIARFIRSHEMNSPRSESPPPPPVTSLPPAQQTTANSRTAAESRLLSDLWLMSGATFRRLGKIEQTKAAIQEAEVKDEGNPAVWVQLGLYYNALGHDQHAVDAFQKALLICPDHVSASVHLCRLYLTCPASSLSKYSSDIDPDNVDLAAGMLSHLTRGAGWDVPEAWYFLAKAYGLQDRKDRERECFGYALELSEKRGVRDMATAIGWCL